MKKISVVVLVYNNIEYLEENLLSIKKQDYTNIEIIINDDCSPKISLQDIKEKIYKTGIQEKYKVITNRLSQNKGTVKNFNDAIKRSSGEIIVPLSCDDLFYDETIISKIAGFFEGNDEYLFASGQLAMYTENLQTKILELPLEENQKYFNGFDSQKLLERVIKGTITPGCSTVYTKKFFVEYGMFDEAYHLVEDYTKAVQAVKKGAQIGLMPFKTIIYRDGGVCNGIKHPSVDKDVILCLNKEIINDSKTWNSLSYKSRREVNKKIELTSKYKTYKIHQKAIFKLKYADLAIINRLQRLKK